jgi:hypothetical protein
MPFSAF